MGTRWRLLLTGLGVLSVSACSGRSLWFGELAGERGANGRLQPNEPATTAQPSSKRSEPTTDAGRGADSTSDDLDTAVPDAGGPFVGPPVPPCELVPKSPQQRFLTNRQYDRTVEDLLGLKVLADGRPPSSLLAPDHPGEIDATAWDGYQHAAEEIAQQVVGTPELLERYSSCELDSEGCLNQTMATFGRRAFRRPLTIEDTYALSVVIDRGAEITEHGTPLEIAEALLYTFLVSPSFLLRSEVGETRDEVGLYLLSDHEVAQRLSYALWGTMPDAELFAAADAGQLRTQDQIRTQATRMLQDVKARDQAKLFHAIYVGAEGSRFWSNMTKDVDAFPEFPTSGTLFREETELFFDHVMFEKSGELEDLFSSSAAFVNQDTAPLYDLSRNDYGPEFELVTLDADARPGFLTRVGFLAANSFPSRTWPSRRGAEILRQVVGWEVGQDSLVESPLLDDPALDTVRKQVDAMTTGDGCRGCHRIVDPFGFVLEGFDAVGRRQTEDPRTGAAIDTRVELVVDLAGTPVTVANPLELMNVLADAPSVSRTYARRWVNFLREAEGAAEACVAQELSPKLTSDGYTILQLVKDIVSSESFYKRLPLD